VTGLLGGYAFCDLLLNQSFQVEAKFVTQLLFDMTFVDE